MPKKEPLHFEQFKEYLDKKLEIHVPKYFKDFREHTDKKFTLIEKKLDKVNERLVRVEGKIEKVDERLVHVEDKIDIHFETIGEMKVRATENEKRTEKLEKLAFI